MPVITLKPVLPTFRHWRKADLRGLVTQNNAPEPTLTTYRKSTGGRNNQGRITMRRRGGGHKQLYRMIDFSRDKLDVPGTVASVEYDPNRTCMISLVKYVDGEKRYILTPRGVTVGQTVVSGPQAEIAPGNALLLRNIPMGTIIHNIEMTPGKGGQVVRSAGASAQLLGKEGKYAIIRMPSGEVRKILLECRATVGEVSNEEHANVRLGKAGRSRNLGRRPRVRGKAMSPKDHPHGGGEGQNSIGMPSPKSKWGWKTLGVRTRSNKQTQSLIVKSRHKKKR